MTGAYVPLKLNNLDNDWGIWGETWEEVIKTYHTPDNAANNMHERIVDEMIEKIQRE